MRYASLGGGSRVALLPSVPR
uniref:Uncharacterized protein n=1 Tax=Arundo donax TaxID=35708 RepID=A0A0A9Q0S1_ARUDO